MKSVNDSLLCVPIKAAATVARDNAFRSRGNGRRLAAETIRHATVATGRRTRSGQKIDAGLFSGTAIRPEIAHADKIFAIILTVAAEPAVTSSQLSKVVNDRPAHAAPTGGPASGSGHVPVVALIQRACLPHPVI